MNNQINNEEELMNLLQQIQIEIRQNNRPPNQIIYSEFQLIKLLSVSRRTIASWRAQRLINYSQIGAKFYYTLADVLEFLDHHKTHAIFKTLRIKL